MCTVWNSDAIFVTVHYLLLLSFIVIGFGWKENTGFYTFQTRLEVPIPLGITDHNLV